MDKKPEEEAVIDFFKDCGAVTEVRISERHVRGYFGHVQFEDTDCVDEAMKKQDDEFMGQRISLDFAYMDKFQTRSKVGSGGTEAPTSRRYRPKSVKPPNGHTLWVGDVSIDATEQDLVDLFESCGKVEMICLQVNQLRNGQFGHVKFCETEAVDKAADLAGTPVKGVPIRVDFAEDKPLAAYRVGKERSVPESSKPDDCRTVWVGGLPGDVTDEMIQTLFEKCGEIKEVRLDRSKRSGTLFCHVEFVDSESVDRAVRLSGERLNCSKIRVDFAENRKNDPTGKQMPTPAPLGGDMVPMHGPLGPPPLGMHPWMGPPGMPPFLPPPDWRPPPGGMPPGMFPGMHPGMPPPPGMMHPGMPPPPGMMHPGMPPPPGMMHPGMPPPPGMMHPGMPPPPGMMHPGMMHPGMPPPGMMHPGMPPPGMPPGGPPPPGMPPGGPPPGPCPMLGPPGDLPPGNFLAPGPPPDGAPGGPAPGSPRREGSAGTAPSPAPGEAPGGPPPGPPPPGAPPMRPPEFYPRGPPGPGHWDGYHGRPPGPGYPGDPRGFPDPYGRPPGPPGYGGPPQPYGHGYAPDAGGPPPGQGAKGRSRSSGSYSSYSYSYSCSPSRSPGRGAR